jgi:hypothetical protein
MIFKYWKELEKSNALTVSRKMRRGKLYKLDGENEVVKQLINLDISVKSYPNQTTFLVS